MRTSALFGAKNFGIFEIYGVSAGTRGVDPVRIFCGQGGEGQFFTIFTYAEACNESAVPISASHNSTKATQLLA